MGVLDELGYTATPTQNASSVSAPKRKRGSVIDELYGGETPAAPQPEVKKTQPEKTSIGDLIVEGITHLFSDEADKTNPNNPGRIGGEDFSHAAGPKQVEEIQALGNQNPQVDTPQELANKELARLKQPIRVGATPQGLNPIQQQRLNEVAQKSQEQVKGDADFESAMKYAQEHPAQVAAESFGNAYGPGFNPVTTVEGPFQLAKGLAQEATRTDTADHSGAKKAIEGLGNTLEPLNLIALENPGALIKMLVAQKAGQEVGSQGAKALGASPEIQDISGQLTGLATGPITGIREARRAADLSRASDEFATEVHGRLSENGIDIPLEDVKKALVSQLKGQDAAQIRQAVNGLKTGKADEALATLFNRRTQSSPAVPEEIQQELEARHSEPQVAQEAPPPTVRSTPQEGDVAPAVARADEKSPVEQLYTEENKSGLTVDEHGKFAPLQVESPQGIQSILSNPEQARETFKEGDSLPAAMTVAEVRAIERATGLELGPEGKLVRPVTTAHEGTVDENFEQFRQDASKEGARRAHILNTESPTVIGEPEKGRVPVPTVDPGVQGETVARFDENGKKIQGDANQAADRERQTALDREQAQRENPLVNDRRRVTIDGVNHEVKAVTSDGIPVIEHPTPEAAQTTEPLRSTPERQGERRVDTATRKSVDDMTTAEMRDALRTDSRTGLRSERAYSDAEAVNPSPFKAITDLDGLGAINDKFGHKVGDQLLQKMGEAFREAGLDSYRKGENADEVVHRGQSKEELETKLQKALDIMATKQLLVRNNESGNISHVVDGLGFSKGISETLDGADKAQYENKQQRTREGKRAAQKGELSGTVRVRPSTEYTGDRGPGREENGNPADQQGLVGETENQRSAVDQKPGLGPRGAFKKPEGTERGSISLGSPKQKPDTTEIFDRINKAAEKKRSASKSGATVVPIKPEAPPEAPQDIAPREEGVTHAASIKLDNLNTTDDIKNFILDVAQKNDNFTKQRRGVISNEKTQSLAEKLGMSEQELAKVKSGTTFNNEELVAAHGVLLAKAEKVQEAARKYAEGGRKQTDLLEYWKQYQEHVAIEAAVAGLNSEAGRALNSLKILKNAIAEKSTSNRQKVLDALRENLGDKWEQKSLEILDNVSKFPEDDVEGLARFLRQTAQYPLSSKINNYYIANLLSGPKTPLKKFFGDVFFGVTQPVVRTLRGAIDNPVSKVQGRQQEYYLREVAPAMRGYLGGMSEGMRKAAFILQHGYDLGNGEALELPQGPEFAGGAANPWNHPRRLLSAVTTMFQSMAFNGELHAQAVRQAIKEGKSGAAVYDRAADLISNPSPEMIEAASKQSKYETYTQDPDGFANAAKRIQSSVRVPDSVPIVGGLEPMRFVVPFVKVPWNLAKAGIENSPLGLLKLAKSDTFKTADASNVIAKASLGSGLMTLGAVLAANGNLTGAAPSDPRKREAFYADGKIPYGVKVGDNWYAYNKLGWLGLTWSAVAAMHDLKTEQPDADITSRISNVMGVIGKSVIDESYFKGIQNLIEAMHDPTNKMESFMGGVASGFVPLSSFLRQIEHSIDNKVRDTSDIYDRIKANIPLIAETLPVKPDRFGRDTERRGDTGIGAFNPVAGSEASPNTAVDAEVNRLGVDVSKVSSNVKVGQQKFKLTDDQERTFQRESGTKVYDALDELINDPAYQDSTDEEKSDQVERLIHAVTRAARLQYLDQFRDDTSALHPITRQRK
jgi:GGDEF domain-containing protein